MRLGETERVGARGGSGVDLGTAVPLSNYATADIPSLAVPLRLTL